MSDELFRVIITPAASYLSPLINKFFPILRLEFVQPPLTDAGLDFIPHCCSKVYLVQGIVSTQLFEYPEVLQQCTRHTVVRYPMEVQDPGEKLLLVVTIRTLR